MQGLPTLHTAYFPNRRRQYLAQIEDLVAVVQNVAATYQTSLSLPFTAKMDRTDLTVADALKANWRVHPQCPQHLIDGIQRAVQALPATFFLRPRAGELFDSPVDALRRLNGFALTRGFAVVKTGGSEDSKFLYISFACIHHGANTRNTRNTRDLEEHVVWDEEGKVVSRRKQEATSIQKRDCQVSWGLSKKQIPRGSGDYRWQLNIPHQFEHSHQMMPYLLSYNPHKKALDTYHIALTLTQTH